MIKIFHIVSVELFAVLLIFKTTLLWRNKHALLGRIDKYLKWPMIFLFLLGACFGLDMYANAYNFYTPAWLQLKFVLLLLSMTTGIIGNLRSNKQLLFLSILFNILIIIVANIKPHIA